MWEVPLSVNRTFSWSCLLCYVEIPLVRTRWAEQSVLKCIFVHFFLFLQLVYSSAGENIRTSGLVPDQILELDCSAKRKSGARKQMCVYLCTCFCICVCVCVCVCVWSSQALFQIMFGIWSSLFLFWEAGKSWMDQSRWKEKVNV